MSKYDKIKVVIEVSGANSEFTRIFHVDCCGVMTYKKNDYENIEILCPNCNLKLSFNNYKDKVKLFQVINIGRFAMIEYPEAIVYLLPVGNDSAIDRITIRNTTDSIGLPMSIYYHSNCDHGEYSRIRRSKINTGLRYLYCYSCKKTWVLEEKHYTEAHWSLKDLEIHGRYSCIDFKILKY